ncbi:hypothetical protein HYFRA_00005152 [Hymenoscyphus fraxineus]|uniref:NACHT domain-containing protein n=1 Tax=Hymenoscyphus fraxineus TaxID=746836 RepID=A0A9N9LAL9_9HELO|nr:hypothetical protein HYFRA_00005152 [Hymenoscyphus fraxineus]
MVHSDHGLELFGSLEPYGRNPRKDRIEDPYPHSFKWLWEQHPDGPGFLEWLQDGTQVFWISGTPGSGKSTLMKQVVEGSQTLEYLKTNAAKPVRILSFFFWELGGNEEQNFLGFLHGFLAQLLRAFKELIPQVMPTFQQLKRNVPLSSSNSPNSISIWSESELIKNLKAIKFEEIHGLTCLFIDGLDECAGDHRKQLEFLLPWIESANTTKLCLKVCIASRRLVSSLEHRLSRFPGFKMHEWTAADISSYTEGKLREAITLTSSEDSPVILDNTQHTLIRDITEKSAGVFLWVKLVVEEMIIGIEEGSNDQELRELNDRLPAELEKLYNDILSKIPSNFLRDTHIYFQLLINALDPYLDLLHFALACEDPRDALCDIKFINEEDYCHKATVRIRSRCRGLIEIRNVSHTQSVRPKVFLGHGTVNFMHPTLGEYSRASGTKYLPHLSTTSHMEFDATVSLMAASLRLVKMGECYHAQSRTDQCRRDINLCQTSLFRFFAYARQAELTTKVAQTIYVEELDVYYQNTEWCAVALGIGHSGNWETNLLCAAIHFGLRLYILEKVQKGVQMKRGSGRPFLFYALDQWRHSFASSVVADLLNYGADVNEAFEDETPWSKLLSLTPGKDESLDSWICICEIMLRYEADIRNPVEPFSKPSPLNKFLSVVAELLGDGHEPSKTRLNKIASVISLFSEKGADITFLSVVAELLVLEEGADISYSDGNGKTPYEVAEDLKNGSPGMWKAIREYNKRNGVQHTHSIHDSGYGTGTQVASVDNGEKVAIASTVIVSDEYDSAETVYSGSEISTRSSPHYEWFVNDLAEILYNATKALGVEKVDLEHIYEMLPDLLKSFASKIGYKAMENTELDISYFVRKYRSKVQIAFGERLELEGTDIDNPQQHIEKENLSEFAMARYLTDMSQPAYTETKNDSEIDHSTPIDDAQEPTYTETENDSDIDPSTPIDDVQAPVDSAIDEQLSKKKLKIMSDAERYVETIQKAPGYEWLISTIRTEVNITRADPDIMNNLRHQILSSLPQPRGVSRKASSQEYQVTFVIDWDPLSFVKEQEYTESPDIALGRAITYTGCVNDAQAAITAVYLSQIWPTTGKMVMEFVMEVVRHAHHAPHAPHAPHACTLPDRTAIEARIDGNKFRATVVGTGDSIAEVVQQFGWLGAALRSSQYDTKIALCSPSVRITHHESSNHSYTREVCGYPTLVKHERGLGLEMPLNMIAELAGSERVNEFDGKIFMKGFSTMLVAAKIAKDLLVWHYLYNPDGERISYLDHAVDTHPDISLVNVSNYRHVVGWSEKCEYMAGAVGANYNIERTGLLEPTSGCLLEKVSFSIGGVTFAIGVKDIALHLTLNGYMPRLNWIDKKYVVLWDDRDKRGWLVNGSSALLHLVRASLEGHRTDNSSEFLLFKQDQMHREFEVGHTPNSAYRVLAHSGNKKIRIWEDESEDYDEVGDDGERIRRRKTKYYCFEDLVKDRCAILEQAMEYQRLALEKSGINIKVRFRKHLEGWEFSELAKQQDSTARVATLQAGGYGWVDFVHSIGAITLLGRGFGNIIQPIEVDRMCPNWRQLPAKKYYLGATVTDLMKIAKNFSRTDDNSIKVSDDLYWHCPGDMIAWCGCQKKTTGQALRNMFNIHHHHDPVQVICPEKWYSRLTICKPKELKDDGAVVFGHSINWPYRWKLSGNDDLEPHHWPENEENKGLEIGEESSITSSHLLIPAETESNSATSIASGGFQSRKSTEETMITSPSMHLSPVSSEPPCSNAAESTTDLALNISSKSRRTSGMDLPTRKRSRTLEPPENREGPAGPNLDTAGGGKRSKGHCLRRETRHL